MSKNWHHVYPHKWRSRGIGTAEVRLVDRKKHNAYHLLCGDMHPADAIKFIAENFLPSNLEISVRER